MPKKVWLLVIGMFVNVIGNSFLWPLNTIYMHEYLGKSLAVAGLVLMANSAAGVVGNLLGGYLFDRIGGFRSIISGIVISILALAYLVYDHNWYPYIIFLTVLGFSGGIIFPSMYAMVGTVWPEGGRKAFNSIYLAQNVGVAIGPAMAGFIASVHIDYIFSANLAFYILFLVIAYFGYKKLEIAPERHTDIIRETTPIKYKAPFYALLILVTGYLITWLVYSQWSTTISTHALSIGVTLREYSLIWTINGLLIVLGQPIIKPLIKRIEKQLKTQMLIGTSIFIISFIVVSFAGSFKMFVVSMVILTFGEMIVWPVIPTIASQLAPKGKDGFYQGVVNSAATIGRMIGPLAGGVLVEIHGMKMMLLLLTSLMVITILTTILYDRPLKSSNQKPEIQ
ncbi:MFS transporter [Sporosarcina thermotolerans]|uniref:MFS transporter n=1 Tax=Sporosarcina thermotolerans TaxID=633404 RepID=A0AAW9AAW6_9BACL|nr:MFS transporter [Sporosarcina thermotolerans]MDW0117130.1 MFS transporter [Sporosarcina thermotolerans]WHT47783.1 MFS transporter [Sporosarcina thermotolerans]